MSHRESGEIMCVCIVYVHRKAMEHYKVKFKKKIINIYLKNIAFATINISDFVYFSFISRKDACGSTGSPSPAMTFISVGASYGPRQ